MIQIHEWNKLFSKVEILGVFSSVLPKISLFMRTTLEWI
jgi:hypothetical protein